MSYYAGTVKQSVSMPQALSYYGLEVNRAGFCSCPFHSERTASFKIYPDGYYCFGCHAHGSVIDFVMQYFNLDFMDAIQKLSDDFSLNLPIGRKPTLRERHAAAPAVNTQAIELARLEREESEAEADWVQADRLVNSLEPMTDEFSAALMEREKADVRWRECEVKIYEFRKHQQDERIRPAERTNVSGTVRG